MLEYESPSPSSVLAEQRCAAFNIRLQRLPSRRAAKRSQELASPHSITSSALASSQAGAVGFQRQWRLAAFSRLRFLTVAAVLRALKAAT